MATKTSNASTTSTAEVPSVDRHPDVIAARDQVATTARQRGEIAATLAEAEQHLAELTATAGLDDLDAIEAAEQQVERQRRRLRLADNQYQPAQRDLIAAQATARNDVLVAADREHVKLLAQADELLAKLEDITAAHDDLERRTRRQVSTNGEIPLTVTNTTGQPIERAGKVFPPRSTTDLYVRADNYMEVQAAVGLTVSGPKPAAAWKGFNRKPPTASDLGTLRARIAGS